MKATLLLVAFEAASRIALAQGAGEPMTHLRIVQSERPAPSGDNWIISETTSPVNYTPIVTATTLSRGGSDDSQMQLAVHCRGGRTELVVSGPAIPGSGDYVISYRVNDGPPVQLWAGSPSFGTGAAFRGDIVKFLQSLPEDGAIIVHLSRRGGPTQDGSFSLGGLKTVREKVAVACKWPPQAVARPRN